MASKRIKIDKGGPIPMVEVVIGQAQLGNYSVVLWDENGQNPEPMRDGNSADDVEDVFRVVQTRDEFSELNGHELSFVVWVKTLNRRPGSRYAWSMMVTQGDRTLGELAGSGTMDKAIKHFDGFFKIELI